MKRHSIDQLAAWAKSWNVKGYEHIYPENREKARQQAIKQYNERRRNHGQKTMEESR